MAIWYTLNTPNTWGLSACKICYRNKESWYDLDTGAVIGTRMTASGNVFHIWGALGTTQVSRPTHEIFATTTPGVTVSIYYENGSLAREFTLSNTAEDSNGQTIYWAQNTTAMPRGIVDPLNPPNIFNPLYVYLANTTIVQRDAAVAAVTGAKTLYYAADDDKQDPYIDYGQGSLGGDVINVPSLPTVTAVDTGLVTIYNPTPGEMRALSDYLWTDIVPGTDTLTVLKEIAQALTRQVSDPLKVILGLSIVPSQGLPVSSSRYAIKAGFYSVPGVWMHKLTSQFYEVDCGSLDFETVCGGTFLDFAPYAKFQIYLPFVGTVSVDANDFVGHTIGVKYHIDALSGSATAFITKDGSVMYSYAANVAVNVPLSEESWTSTIQASLQMVTSFTGAVKNGVSAGVSAAPEIGAARAAVKGIGATLGSGLVSTAGYLASNPTALSPEVSRSGAIGGSSGAMNVMTPYVIREAVTFQSTAGMNDLKGYPLHKVQKIGEVSGYTEISNVHIEGINATTDERTEIENLLGQGVIL